MCLSEGHTLGNEVVSYISGQRIARLRRLPHFALIYFKALRHADESVQGGKQRISGIEKTFLVLL